MRLLIVQRRLTHYRVPFFERLRERLAGDGIRLTLAVGEPTPAEAAKRDEGTLDWAQRVPCRYLLGGRLVRQPVAALAAAHELTVVTQENRLLDNLPLLLGRPRTRVALWGHGRNFQAGAPRGAAQAWKAALSRRADWWFAYTELSAEVVRGFGYPAARISVLNNAIDLEALEHEVRAAATRGRAALRRAHGLPPHAPVGLFVGSLYPDKRLDLLLDSAEAVRAARPDFQLVVVGAGPQLPLVQAHAAGRGWIHVLGARHGRAKAELLAGADLLLNPGLVGLGILDGFAAGLPLLTTDCRLHSPEIAYLRPGHNGLITAPEPGAFAQAVLQLLDDAPRRARLAEGSRQSARDYGLPAMVERFAAGVAGWRASPRLAGGAR